MTDRDRPESPSAPADTERAATPVVAVVLLVALTALLASTVLAVVGVDTAGRAPAPQAHVDATLSATDGWPDGQQLRLVHEAGDTLAVADLAVVVELDRPGTHTRLAGFPTRRLTAEHVEGDDLFDATYAGVDGELDAAHTDGRWESGEAASVRIAQRAFDVVAGDRVTVTVVHRPSGAQVARIEVQAT